MKHSKENVRYSRGMGALGSCRRGGAACGFAGVEAVGAGRAGEEDADVDALVCPNVDMRRYVALMAGLMAAKAAMV